MTNKKLLDLLEDCVASYNAGDNELLTRIVLHDEESETPYQVLLACTEDGRACWQHDRYVSLEDAKQLVKDSWDVWKRVYTGE